MADSTVRDLESVLTLTAGKIVHAAQEFAVHNPPLSPISPDWSPAKNHRYDNSNPIPPRHQHTPIMGADARVWETDCGCAI